MSPILGVTYFGALSAWAIAVALASDPQWLSQPNDPRTPPRYTFGFAIAFAATFTRTLGDALAAGVACVALVFGQSLSRGKNRVLVPSALMMSAVSLLTDRIELALVGAAIVGGIAAGLSVALRRRVIGTNEARALALVGAAFGPIQSEIVIGFALACWPLLALSPFGRDSDGNVLWPALAFGACVTLVFGGPIAHALLGGTG